MSDPEKNVKFVFQCYEKESADLKIRLRYDGLTQSNFFRSLLRMYISQDPTMLSVVEKIKRDQKIMGERKIKNTRKDYESASSIMVDLGITSADKRDIFDLIELGDIEDV